MCKKNIVNVAYHSHRLAYLYYLIPLPTQVLKRFIGESICNNIYCFTTDHKVYVWVSLNNKLITLNILFTFFRCARRF